VNLAIAGGSVQAIDGLARTQSANQSRKARREAIPSTDAVAALVACSAVVLSLPSGLADDSGSPASIFQ
jgi:hypothetical protein